MSGEPGESVSLSGYARYRARNSVSRDSPGTVWEHCGPNMGPVWEQANEGTYLIFCLQFSAQLGTSLGPVWDHLWRAKLSILAEECHKHGNPVVAWNGKRS